MRIVFFNHYHNGDIFASKGYIADLIKEFKGHELIYQHFNSPKLLRDLNIDFRTLDAPLGSFTDRTPLAGDRDSIYVNTWIGNYLPYGDGINWRTYHDMFKKIYSALSNVNDRSIDFGPVEYYFPQIDYDYFDIPNIKIPSNSVIISNGPVLSGQSELQDLNKLIQSVLDNTDKNIILTHFAPFNSDRIAFTNNLISTTGGDLNEIAWIAEQCDYIIGRNSGPFCFMTNKSIMSNKNKTIISIGNNEKDSFIYNIPIDASYYFIHDDEINKIMDIVK
jgi:hypothetical protein